MQYQKSKLRVTPQEYDKIHRLATRHDLTDTLWVEGLKGILGEATVQSLQHKSTEIVVDPKLRRAQHLTLVSA